MVLARATSASLMRGSRQAWSREPRLTALPLRKRQLAALPGRGYPGLVTLQKPSIPLLLLAALGSGCSGLCQGPACEDAFSGGRISLVLGPTPTATQIPGDADASWVGDRAAGSDWAVGALGPWVVVGQPDASRVVVLNREFDLVAELAEPVADFGAAVMGTADDASWELWVGAPGFDRGRGAVFVYRGASVDQVPTFGEAVLRIEGGAAFDRLGEALLACPDLTGDGVRDVLLPAPFFEPGPTWPHGPVPSLAGAVFGADSTVVGGVTGVVDVHDVGAVWWGTVQGEGAGTAVACDDRGVYVGAPWWQLPEERGESPVRGRVHALPGFPAAAPLAEVSAVDIAGRAIDEWFGASLVAWRPGDARQLAIGGPGYAGGVGRASVYDVDDLERPRLVSTLDQAADHAFPDHFGRAFYQGDVDGDGAADLIAAAPDFRDRLNAYDVGRMWIWSGATVLEEEETADLADYRIEATRTFSRIGRRAAVADVNGDGVDDLLIPSRIPTPAQ